MSLPTGTVTFLLTDIAGSSRLWQDRPDDMAGVIERHDALIRNAVEAHGGVFVKSKGEGDSTFSVFARSSEAVAAVLDAERALVGEQWPDGIGLRVRAALHTGEAELRDGNYYGKAVNRCARLRAIAHGGQILMTESTHALVADNSPPRAALRDLGMQRLRDLDRAERVWQLSDEGAEDFPPLRTGEATPNNLPARVDSFVGRDAEIAEVRSLLRDHRVVTLTGSGGVGKTRLATEVAATLLDDYPDGVWWVDLSPTTSVDVVPKAITAAMRVRDVSTRTTTELLLIELKEAHTLVLLDNCEHLIDACAELCDLLVRNCPHTTILATSRESLAVAGEAAWRVPSLTLPRDADGVESASVQLFRDRARAVRPNFRVTGANAPALAEICCQLEGIPLAIEIAAARVRVLTPQQIASGLRESFQLLAGRGPRALPRQRTLEASVDWSYSLLADDERELLRRLSVFAGGFSLDAAEAVWSDDDTEAYRVLELLSALVDKSLVQVDDSGEQARYRLLETIRQYAAQRLVDSGEGPEVGNRHLRFYADTAEQNPLDSAPDTELMARITLLETEHDNFRAALEWAVRAEDVDAGLRLCSALGSFWYECEHGPEGFLRARAILDLHGGDPVLRCRAMSSAAAVSFYDSQTGLAFAEEAIALARRLGDPTLEAQAFRGLALNRINVDLDASRRAYEQCLELAERAGDAHLINRSSVGLGLLATIRGDLLAARECAERARNARAPNRLTAMWSSFIAGWVAFYTGDVRECEMHVSAALEIARELHATRVLRLSLSFVVGVAIRVGDVERAEATLAEADRLSERIGVPSLVDEYFRGELQIARRNYDAAAESLVRYARIVESTAGNDAALALTFAATCMAVYDLKGSRDVLEQAGKLVADPLSTSLVSYASGLLARVDGDIDRDEKFQHEALTTGLEPFYKQVVVVAMEELAGVATIAGRPVDAARIFGAAESYRRLIGFTNTQFRAPDFYTDDVATTREQLGEEAFDRAWSEGAAMSLDEAVAYVQRGRGERKRPSSGWDSLTPTELDVVRLVADGLSNPQIAEKMFISRRTVTTHLTHIFAKLGISSRTELATEATRRGALA